MIFVAVVGSEESGYAISESYVHFRKPSKPIIAFSSDSIARIEPVHGTWAYRSAEEHQHTDL